MWVLIVVLGQTYGVVGPLDRTAWTCPYVLTRAKEMIAIYIAKEEPVFMGKVVRPEMVTTKCVISATQPTAPRRINAP